MRPITLVPPSGAAKPTKTATVDNSVNQIVQSDANESSSSNPEINGRPLNNGNATNAESKPIPSPLSPSSSTLSIPAIKKPLTKSESQAEILPLAKKPPPVVKKISLLSESISKFEQNADTSKPKVSWKNFIKPSPSKDKLAGINGNNDGTSPTTMSVKNTPSEVVKPKAIDENNNEVKTELSSSSAAPVPHIIAENELEMPQHEVNGESKAAFKSEPPQSGLISSVVAKIAPDNKSSPITESKSVMNITLSSTKVSDDTLKSPTQSMSNNLEHKSDTTLKSDTLPKINGNHDNSEVITSNNENGTEPSAAPVKVKRIVKKIVRKVVTKSSTDLTNPDAGAEKVVKIVKKKVIKPKAETSDSDSVQQLPEITDQTLTNGAHPVQNTPETEKAIDPHVREDKILENTNNPIASAPLDISIKSSVNPELTLDTNLRLPESPNLLLNGKQVTRPSIRPMLPAHRSQTIDLGAAVEAVQRLPPTPPALLNCHLQHKGSPPLKERRRSWGKMDKLPLSLALSRDSTLDDFSKESSLISRSPSPYSLSTTRSSSILSNYESWQSSRSVTPRRLSSMSYDEHDFDFPIIRASPARSEKSDYLSEKIDHFLKRTDHVMQEWKKVGQPGRSSDCGINDLCMGGVGALRSKSVSSIMSQGLMLLRDHHHHHPRSASRSSSRMSSVSRDIFHDAMDDDNRTVVDDMELSEMTAELAEEHSSSNLISERLDAETTERLRLEKEVKEHEEKYRHLQESSEKLEMELLCAKSDLNGDLDDDFDGDGDGNAYRIKYERVARELEFTKKRLQTQHEHDLEQLIGLKKQLEKKLADAYEEVEEQRQVVGQWKRKAQKMTNEMNDLRMLLEEQNSRNNLLEKRQRKFDSECQSLQDSARQEKQSKERLTREKDVLIAEKFTLEQTLSDVRLELELKEEKYTALQRELEEMTFGGGTEEEIAQLKRQKMDLDRRCKEQEEELDEMAGQIQLLEQAKLRLEMSLETMRKDARKEAQQRDDELEEVRGSSYKKIKSLECQLEQEHEERTSLLREKHDLERRLSSLEEQDRAERAAEEAASQKLKRDLRKYKALLRDAQSQLERAKTDSAGKALIRQLRNQLEDAESARSTAVKARQVAEGELQDVQLMLEEAQRARFDAEDKAQCALRDRTELQAQIDENEEEMAELMKKYSTTVKQLSSEQAIIADYEFKISELESEKKSLKEQITDLTTRLESVENIGDSSSSIQFKRLELRTKELESRLEFEQATRARMEIQLNRHKDSLEKAQSEISQIRTKEMLAQEALKKAQKTIRELREELHLVVNKEQESLAKRKDLEKRYETVEAEAASARADLRLALQRIADLQQAMEEGDSYHSDSENSDSSIDSVSETSYRSPSVLSSIRGRSGETNGTNGSGTTLCIREEKENTPRIRSKFKIGRITRRRLPFTIKEEEEDESTLRSSLDSKKNLLSDAFHEESDAQIDTVLESIKNAIGEDDDQELNKTDPPPKYTGAIRKVFNTSANKDNSDNLARCPSEMDDKLDVSQKNAFTDENNNDKWLGEKLSESSIVREIGNASTAIAAHVQADDSRFDLDALKSIKEKIRNINRTLKEEANELVSRQKYEFPPPPTLSSPKPDKTNGIIDMTEMIKKPNTPPLTDRLPNDFNESLKKETKPELGSTSSDKLAEGISKLDHIDSQLNVDGIRSIKEKIQQLKRKLQDESGPSTDTVDKNQLISEISEMKKTLTAAFISKGNDHKSTILRSSSLKRSEGSAAPVNERKENHSLTDLVSSAKVPEHAEILPSTSSSKPLFSINQVRNRFSWNNFWKH
ncbi:myosin-8 isoform X10 [Uranotaenia lowii]|uniref:myosin-8 isoform X10 n=1 Tax=Uranotaenia lowii TaxID=190385 RepID=UPI0024790E27|nr:myosin-8 isoform X10 [Uranotaenia lowii]